jgi:hypothetical protein
MLCFFKTAKIIIKFEIPMVFNKKRDVNPYNIPGNLIYNWLTFSDKRAPIHLTLLAT